ncbi:MAG: hypothetical protein R3B46_01360 [Phycisphaerales bacterium]
MARPTPSPRPSPLWVFMGFAMLAHFAMLAWFKRTNHIEGELLWFSHAGLLLGALALIARSTNLAATAFILVAGFHILWIADATLGLTTGDFPVGGTRFLLTADTPTLALTTHHLYLAPILAIFLLRRKRIPITALPAALILLIALTATSRLTLPPSMNINYAHAALASSTNPALVWFNALPTRQYLPVHAAFCLLVFLIPSVIIMKTLIAARSHTKRRATSARVSPERAHPVVAHGAEWGWGWGAAGYAHRTPRRPHRPRCARGSCAPALFQLLRGRQGLRRRRIHRRDQYSPRQRLHTP